MSTPRTTAEGRLRGGMPEPIDLDRPTIFARVFRNICAGHEKVQNTV